MEDGIFFTPSFQEDDAIKQLQFEKEAPNILYNKNVQ
jgi:hypothetical protein